MILRPIQFVYDFTIYVKNKLYDHDVIKKVDLNIPVISIGNLSVGGTGKTPCVYLVATELIEKKIYKKIVIVSRSYKGTLKQAQRVNLSLDNATAVFGDEPCMLQSKLPNCSVWAGPTKHKTAKAAALSEKPDLIIIDDGFSHRKLNRHFDLILIDATAPLNYFQTLPVGRLRESTIQLKRAHAVLLTKTNLVDNDKIKKITDLILKNNSDLINSIYLASAKLNFGHLSPQHDQIYAFCGLGNPESFQQSLQLAGFNVVSIKKYADHYQYTQLDLDNLLADFFNKKKEIPNLKLVTTAKDLIKIQKHPLLKEVHEIDYAIEIDSLKKVELFEKICRLL